MPSRPMLTTPARSAHRPARPASAIGMKAVIASRRVPAESSSLLPVMTRANEISVKATSSQPQIGTRRGARPAGVGMISGVKASLATVMPATSVVAGASCSATARCSWAWV